jgi:pyruvate, water dikinase
MEPRLISSLREVNYHDLEQVGGKAASLGEMSQAGLPVPPGFVVTVAAFKHGLDKALESEVTKAYDELGHRLVAVRSSAVAEDSKSASWAGQLESYLNVERDELVEAVKKCWASINSERATEYALEHGLSDDQEGIAVVVQAMVNSDISGVLFTANPLTGDRQQMLIEAAYGLGELLVQGEITPESITVDKLGMVLDRSPSRQQVKLSYKGGSNKRIAIAPPEQVVGDSLLHELVAAAARVEEHYGAPQDIEWAVEGGKLYIVQSRPITTLEPAATGRATFEKAFTREESLMLVELLAREVDQWLKQLTPKPPASMFFRFNNGLTETWLGEEATRTLIDAVYENNLKDPGYLPRTVTQYQRIVAELAAFEEQGSARSLDELKSYLEIFRQAIVPIHTIFFTPFREDTPKKLYDLAVKTRGEDALFDNGDLYVRDSLVQLYPKCDGVETFIGLADLDEPRPSELRERENNFICFKGVYLAMSLEQFRSANPDFRFKIEPASTGNSSIAGSVAYGGIAQGKARVVMRKNEVSGFEVGQVLVAPMTTPHYLPAMRKAVAFVTDEGGVTCHAAIVAREMKKPCVIGTKVATQVIRDGDDIEVNADLGVVSVLGAS